MQSQRLNGNGFSDDAPLCGTGFIDAICANMRGHKSRNFLDFFVIGVEFVGNPAGNTHGLIVAGNIGATLGQNVGGKITGISGSAYRFHAVVKLVGQTDRTNFSALNFLFTKYTKHNNDVIFNKISTSTTEADIQEIKSMLPRSNWDRYFKEHIECDENTLNSKWHELYKLRNQVAHNAPFSLSDYKKVEELVDFVKPIITSSIDKLSIINITESEKEELKLADIYLENHFPNAKKWHSLNDDMSIMAFLNRSLIRGTNATEIAKMNMPKPISEIVSDMFE